MAFGRSRDLPTPTAFSGKAYGPGSGIQHQQHNNNTAGTTGKRACQLPSKGAPRHGVPWHKDAADGPRDCRQPSPLTRSAIPARERARPRPCNGDARAPVRDVENPSARPRNSPSRRARAARTRGVCTRRPLPIMWRIAAADYKQCRARLRDVMAGPAGHLCFLAFSPKCERGTRMPRRSAAETRNRARPQGAL